MSNRMSNGIVDKKKPRKPSRDYKAAATKLASCVVFALKFLKAPGGGIMFNIKTGKAQAWQDDFMDALETVGIMVDRDEYWNRKEKRNKA